jgi:hypothetical protein
MINEYLTDFLEAGLTPAQLKLARISLARYAMDAIHDSSVEKEAWDIALDGVGTCDGDDGRTTRQADD